MRFLKVSRDGAEVTSTGSLRQFAENQNVGCQLVLNEYRGYNMLF